MNPAARQRPRPRLLRFAGGLPAIGPAVFGAAGSAAGAGRRMVIATAFSVTVYAGVGWLAMRTAPARPPEASPRPPDLAVDLFEIPPPPPPPMRAPPPSVRPPIARAPAEPAAPRAAPEPPAPARAADAIAREPQADEPVDLTGFTIATGDGKRYAGGDTTSGGTSDRAVSGPTAASARGSGGGGAANLSRPVGIPEDEWSDCAWPQEADALGIDEQTVSMRAVARADGSFESGRIVSDPGYGFGAALLACARRHGFVPALDIGGKSVRAESGVIRFKFTR